MNWLGDVDWTKVFLPETPLLEIFIRGTVMYLALYTLLRVVLRRQRGSVGVNDLLVLVLIADAAQNAMAGSYSSIADGVLLVAVIIGWAAVLDWLAYRIPMVDKFLHAKPLVLFENGQLRKENMAKEFVTEGELREQLRLQGIADLDLVERVTLEGDGQMSVLRRDGNTSRHHRRDAF